jgi:hypothetical protein
MKTTYAFLRVKYKERYLAMLILTMYGEYEIIWEIITL